MIIVATPARNPLNAYTVLSVIKNGLTMMSVDAQYQEFIIGMILLLAVIVTELRQKSLKKLKKSD